MQERPELAAICQTRLPARPWAEDRLNRLPGLNPVSDGEWLLVDEVYAAQMALRERLLAEKGDAVLRVSPGSVPACAELLDAVVDEVTRRAEYVREGEAMVCPDGRRVVLDRSAPLATAARLVQEDLVVLEKPDGHDEHILTAAALCFPASWTLAEKYLRPLTGIHAPVEDYDDGLAKRVQRVFDGVQPGRSIWRMNYLIYADPALFQPRREAEKRPPAAGPVRWLRMERQVIRRLPASRAVVFSIHSYVMSYERLSPEDRATLSALKPVD